MFETAAAGDCRAGPLNRAMPLRCVAHLNRLLFISESPALYRVERNSAVYCFRDCTCLLDL